MISRHDVEPRCTFTAQQDEDRPLVCKSLAVVSDLRPKIRRVGRLGLYLNRCWKQVGNDLCQDVCTGALPRSVAPSRPRTFSCAQAAMTSGKPVSLVSRDWLIGILYAQLGGSATAEDFY